MRKRGGATISKPRGKDQVSFREDEKYYRKNLPALLEQYSGEYIALINQQVVDSDTDFSQLAQRVYAKFGYRDIFMPKVTEKEEVVHIRTPFLSNRKRLAQPMEGLLRCPAGHSGNKPVRRGR